LKVAACVGSDRVPSTKEFSPHLNTFLAMKDGSLLDFIDVPLSPPSQRDPNTPTWLQHIALKADSMDELLDIKKRAEKLGVDVIGPANHGMCQSIYFFDPSGHRLEIAFDGDPAILEEMGQRADAVLAKWEAKKKLGWDDPNDPKDAKY
jgi:glyoxylase I family protein